jgi:hypothetical protein
MFVKETSVADILAETPQDFGEQVGEAHLVKWFDKYYNAFLYMPDYSLLINYRHYFGAVPAPDAGP